MSGRFIAAILLLVAIGLGFASWLQRKTGDVLRAELGQLREDRHELARLNAENQRLTAQVNPGELERLRADRAALLRLRAEVTDLRSRIEARAEASNAIEASAGPGPAPARAPDERPPLMLSPNALVLTVGADGNLALEDRPLDFDAFKQRLVTMAAANERVDIALRFPAQRVDTNVVDQNMDRLMALGRELKIKMMVGIERPRK